MPAVESVSAVCASGPVSFVPARLLVRHVPVQLFVPVSLATYAVQVFALPVIGNAYIDIHAPQLD